jgi:hypothetical protein
MADTVQLKYTPIWDASHTLVTLTFPVKIARATAEPDDWQLGPYIKHSFPDGTQAEQNAGGRRKPYLDLSVIDNRVNRLRLLDFQNAEDKQIVCLAGTPGSLVVGSQHGSGLANGTWRYAVRAIDCIGGSIAAGYDGSANDTAGGADNQMQITYTGVSDARCYMIYRKFGTAHWFILDSTTGLSYLDDGTVTPYRDLGVGVTPPAVVSSINIVNESDTFKLEWVNNFEGARAVRLSFDEADVNQFFPV